MSTMTPSVEYLAWLRQHGIDPDSEPDTIEAQARRRAERLRGLANSIERQKARLAQASTSREHERALTRLSSLEAQREALEQQQAFLDDVADTDWRYHCASCDGPIPHGDYGAAVCRRCDRKERA